MCIRDSRAFSTPLWSRTRGARPSRYRMSDQVPGQRWVRPREGLCETSAMGFGRRRRERALQELLERMERLDRREVDLSDPASGTRLVARRRTALPSLLVLLVIIGMFGAWRFGLLARRGDFGRPPTYVTVNGSRIAGPFPPKNTTRLLPPVQVS